MLQFFGIWTQKWREHEVINKVYILYIIGRMGGDSYKCNRLIQSSLYLNCRVMDKVWYDNKRTSHFHHSGVWMTKTNWMTKTKRWTLCYAIPYIFRFRNVSLVLSAECNFGCMKKKMSNNSLACYFWVSITTKFVLFITRFLAATVCTNMFYFKFFFLVKKY